MIKKIFTIVIVVLLVIVGFIGFFSIVTEEVDASGPTYIGGILSENTTWTIENSPYIVTNNILVEENVNLTIQPGVHVKFNSDNYLRVDGILFAVGYETMRIIFTSNTTSPSPGDWGGIRFKNTCQDSILSYCIIKYGGGNISGGGIKNEADNLTIRYSNIDNNSVTGQGGGIHNLGKITIENSIISNNFAESMGGGIHNDESAILLINGSKIINNNSTHYGGGIYNDYSATAIISNSKISNNIAYSDNRHGGGVFNYGSITVKFCEISNNIATDEGGGFWNGGSATIDYSRIYNNSASSGGGIFYGGISTKITVKGSDIINNYATYGGGIYVYGGKSLDLHYCNINNSNHNIYLVDSSLDVDVTNNWWETTDTDSINISIHDYYDDFDLGKVLYKPFRTFHNNISNQLPNKPTIPNGSTSGITNTSYTYSIFSFDTYGDRIKYGWDWDGDGTVEEWSSLLDSGTEDNISYNWSIAGVYNVKVKTQDEHGAESDWSDTLTVTITNPPNNPPIIPIMPSGPSSGITNTSYSFFTSTTDLEGDQIKYGWDWNGNGVVDEWSSLNESGIPDNRQHMWSMVGTYNVTVIVEDEYGEQSEWSNPLVVSITEKTEEPDINGDDENINESNIVIFLLIIIIVMVIIAIIFFLLKRT